MRAKTPLAERFWAKVKPLASGCLEWTGARKEFGHGVMGLGGRGEGLKRATHVAWFLYYGRWPAQQLNHKCNNAWCVNAEHVYEGTQAQNCRDSAAVGTRSEGPRHQQRCREAFKKGDAHHLTKFPEAVRVRIRLLRLDCKIKTIVLASLFNTNQRTINRILRDEGFYGR